MTRWITLEEFPNYEVNNLGQVRNKKTGRILKPSDNGIGYMQIVLFDNGRNKHTYVHRLVAEEFIDNPENYSDVNHIDGNKRNNNINNLEWCSRSENHKHAYSTGLHKPTIAGTPQIRIRIVETGEEFESISECARRIDCDQGNLSRCIKGNNKTCKGYHFKAIE